MKNLTLIIISIFLVSYQAYAQDSFTSEKSISEEITTELTVTIAGLKSDEGTLKVGIYDSEGTWLSKSKYRQTTDISNGTATVVFEISVVCLYLLLESQVPSES